MDGRIGARDLHPAPPSTTRTPPRPAHLSPHDHPALNPPTDSGSASGISRASTRRANARYGRSSRRGARSRSRPPSTSTHAPGTSCASVSEAPSPRSKFASTSRTTRRPTRGGSSSQTPPHQSRRRTDGSRSRSPWTRASSPPAKPRNRRLHAGYSPLMTHLGTFISIPVRAIRLTSCFIHRNRVAWVDVTGSGAELQLRDVTLESYERAVVIDVASSDGGDVTAPPAPAAPPRTTAGSSQTTLPPAAVSSLDLPPPPPPPPPSPTATPVIVDTSTDVASVWLLVGAPLAAGLLLALCAIVLVRRFGLGRGDPRERR